MLFILVLVTITNYGTYATYDGPLLDGSKFAFIQDPYVNIVKTEKDVSLQDNVSARWPNGVVRYYVDVNSYDDNFDVYIKSAIQIVQANSCIKFMRMPTKSSDNITWIHITNPRKDRECNHEPSFMDNGEIRLVFGYDCLKTNELLHTLLHGIGFQDEVTHPHRDKYIRVMWDNIHPGMICNLDTGYFLSELKFAYRHLYRKQAEIASKTLVEYDPLSVMQFHDRAFSRNGRATLTPLEAGISISPSETLSQLDKMRLHMYFGQECNKRKVSDLLQTCKKTLKEEIDDKPDEEDKNEGGVLSDDDGGDRSDKTANDEDQNWIESEKKVADQKVTVRDSEENSSREDKMRIIDAEIIVLGDQSSEENVDRHDKNVQTDNPRDDEKIHQIYGSDEAEKDETKHDRSSKEDVGKIETLGHSQSDTEEKYVEDNYKDNTDIEKSVEQINESNREATQYINTSIDKTGENELKHLHESGFEKNITKSTSENKSFTGNTDKSVNTSGAYKKSSETDNEVNFRKNLV